MPIFEFECTDCGRRTEILMGRDEENLVVCAYCGSHNLKKLISAHAAVSATKSFPTNASDRCCGTAGPTESCSGPGSCCGRRF